MSKRLSERDREMQKEETRSDFSLRWASFCLAVNSALSHFIFRHAVERIEPAALLPISLPHFFSLSSPSFHSLCFCIEKRDGKVAEASFSFTSRYGFLFHSFYGLAMLFGFQYCMRNRRYVSPDRHSNTHTTKTLAQIQPVLFFFFVIFLLFHIYSHRLLPAYFRISIRCCCRYCRNRMQSKEFVCVLVGSLISFSIGHQRHTYMQCNAGRTHLCFACRF